MSSDKVVFLDPNDAVFHEALPDLADAYKKAGFAFQALVAVFADENMNCNYIHMLGKDFSLGLVAGALDVARHNIVHHSLYEPEEDED